MNSSKAIKLFAGAALCLCLASCGKGAKIEGTIKDAPQSDVIVKLLDVNEYKVLDTVKTNASGAFSYKVEMVKGQPEFVYLFHGDVKIASLILLPGDKVKVTADTLGRAYTVEGSEESAKLEQVENDFRDFTAVFAAEAARAAELEYDSPEIKALQRNLSSQYVNYYRSRVKYVLENPFSLSSIPVLYQSLNENFSIFSQQTDAIHFRNVHDSLATVYPDSKYVKALEKEASRREKLLDVNTRFSFAEEVGFIDLNMPDTKGQKVSMKSLDSKVVMVHFWQAADEASKQLNQDILKKVYADYKGRGLEIYSVSLDTDKAVWATTVKNQNLEWVNVCDGLGINSPAVSLYGVRALPSSYFIVNGQIVEDVAKDEATLRALLNKYI